MAHNRDFGAVDGLRALLVPGVGTADPYPLSVCPGARPWAGEVYPDGQCPGQRLDQSPKLAVVRSRPEMGGRVAAELVAAQRADVLFVAYRLAAVGGGVVGILRCGAAATAVP